MSGRFLPVLVLALCLTKLGCGGDGGSANTNVNSNENGNANGNANGNGNANNNNGPAVCGDGVVASGEACDDGLSNSDTEPNRCRTGCVLPWCGDSVVDNGEACDDGAANSDVEPNRCRTSCLLAHCGDGVLDTGEACDDGPANSDAEPDRCRAECVLPWCGDSVVDDGEACDDGPANSDVEPDRCRTGCVLPRCGDSVVDTGEECDDGPTNSDTEPDGCRTSCQLAHCGDGVLDTGEECDGTDLGDTTCLDVVVAGGSLGCALDCTFDLTGCNELIWVGMAGGTFPMGSTVRAEEQPVHSVNVPGFDMTKTEVTVSQYGACVSAGACTAPATAFLYCNWGAYGYEDHPVNCLDWSQARTFCTWAAGRLPTEAEWEYAARSGGQANDYPWGNDTPTCSYAVMNEGGNGCGVGRTWSICSVTAGNTSQGLCDMAGNVWEWVEDDWHADYTGAPSDGGAWFDSPRATYRVLRGGSFLNVASPLRAAYRLSYGPSAQTTGIGFRCAR